MVIYLYGLEVYEDPIHMFYANLRLSQDSGEFDTKFYGVIPYMNGSWLENFAVIFEEAKRLFLTLKLVYPTLVLFLSILDIGF